MSSDDLYTVKIEPLTSGPEVVVVDSEPPMRRVLDHHHLQQQQQQQQQQQLAAREEEHKLRTHYLLAGGQDTTAGVAPVPVHLRNTAVPMQVVDNPYANGMQAQNQLMEQVRNLETELARTKQEINQLKELNTRLQQGIPDVIRKTLRDELRKPRWSALNPQDQAVQGSAASNKPRTASSNAQKRHKPSPMQRAVLKARDSPAKMTKKLLTSFFDRETLATSTLTGKGGKSKTLTKAQLDPTVVKNVVDKVTATFGISECSVRNVISQKCKEEMMIRRRRLGLDAKSK
ncbi:uncharacterized protein LOC119736104 [Patiria miniata]|uniref:BEN domain-containing protein n=1 Tax=Patiria miniata TaxID=46514 RepID=A0A914AQW3_PATMI|nr:uncharacterized protein LOC119736104 [Patiria miniata]